ncbi:hypothetical protein [Planctomicrobium sp. SH664]|uniref:hypothetical protein n=1 Tax=Planctomicrobium sp. SH664 TaxID=3448125 RepID=UPI003F5C4E8E
MGKLLAFLRTSVLPLLLTACLVWGMVVLVQFFKVSLTAGESFTVYSRACGAFDLICEFVKHDHRWPTSWDDLSPHAAAIPEADGCNLDEIRQTIRIDFAAMQKLDCNATLPTAKLIQERGGKVGPVPASTPSMRNWPHAIANA